MLMTSRPLHSKSGAMSDRPETPLLDRVHYPDDIRRLDKNELPQLADELRQEVISAVSVTGGHLGAGLGVVELTVAIHYVFDTPGDRLVWDVGHQAYPHKILTGRRDRIRTLRSGGGACSSCAFISSTSLALSNGARPASSVYSTMPSE